MLLELSGWQQNAAGRRPFSPPRRPAADCPPPLPAAHCRCAAGLSPCLLSWCGSWSRTTMRSCARCALLLLSQQPAVQFLLPALPLVSLLPAHSPLALNQPSRLLPLPLPAVGEPHRLLRGARQPGQPEHLQVQRPCQPRQHAGRGGGGGCRGDQQEQQEEHGGPAQEQRHQEERAPHQPRCRP